MHIYQHLWRMNWQLSSRLPGFTAFKLRSSEALALSTSSRRIFAGLMSRWTTGGAKLAWKPKDLSPYGGNVRWWDGKVRGLCLLSVCDWCIICSELSSNKQDGGWMVSEKDTLWRTSFKAGCIWGVAIILSLDWLVNVTYSTITTVSPSEIRTMIWQCISACSSQSLSIICNQGTMCIQTSSNVSASSLRFLGVATQRPKLPKHIRQGQYDDNVG